MGREGNIRDEQKHKVRTGSVPGMQAVKPMHAKAC